MDMTNFDTTASNGAPKALAKNEDGLPRETIHLFRSKFLDKATCYEQIRLINYGLMPLQVTVSFQFEADFADIFEVRGTKRAKKGQRLPDTLEGDAVVLSYLGLDHVSRKTHIAFTPRPRVLNIQKARYEFTLEPKQEQSVFVTVSCERNAAPVSTAPYLGAFDTMHNRYTNERLHECQISTSNKRVNAWLKRSEADLRMLTDGNPEGQYPYAGVPWFSTVFGRDGIITALEMLWVDPSIAKGVLEFLAETQATEQFPRRKRSREKSYMKCAAAKWRQPEKCLSDAITAPSMPLRCSSFLPLPITSAPEISPSFENCGPTFSSLSNGWTPTATRTTTAS